VNLGNSGTHQGSVPRATRYPIQTRVRLRERGQTEWREGTTVNISRTGVLFQSGSVLPAKSLIEMQIILPYYISGGFTADVLCWGPVVRTDASLTKKCGQPVLAAVMLRYRFSHE